MPETYVRPRATSWDSVFGGWLAALGSLAIFFPLGALGVGMSPAGQMRADDPALAFPLVLALFVSWLSGGYVAGRMAGYRRSWHGLMSAMWGLFVGLVIALVAGGNAGDFASVGASLPRLDLSDFGNATVFGFVLGIAGLILGGWLGGMLAPAPLVRVVERAPASAPVVERRREVVDGWPAAAEPAYRHRPAGQRHELRDAPERDGEVRRQEETEVRS